MPPHRTLCDVLDDLRKCYTTRNFASLLGLVEEAQMMGHRMEAALEEYKDMMEEVDEN